MDFSPFFYETADPRTRDYFLCASPWPVLSIGAFYLLFVLKIGPQIMKNRQPVNVKNILMVYNILQVVVNLWLLTKLLKVKPTFNIFCEELDPTDSPKALTIIKLHYMYILIKALDLFDTIVIVLRKNERQLSFLHVYHHCGIFIGSFIAFKYLPGGILLFLGMFNMSVHAIMYFYYFLTSWNPIFKTYTIMKKALTQLQIVQFVSCLIVFLIAIFNPNCGYPKPWLVLYCTQMVLMIVLFTNFYINTYVKKKPSLKNL